jgi:hypothetical protein
MLGTDPVAGSHTTRLRINLLPLQLTFADGGVTLDPTDRVHEILRSPIFRRSRYLSGNTQYSRRDAALIVLGRRAVAQPRLSRATRQAEGVSDRVARRSGRVGQRFPNCQRPGRSG